MYIHFYSASKIVSREPSEEDQPAIFQHPRIQVLPKTQIPSNVTIQSEPENRQKIERYMPQKSKGLFEDSDEDNDTFIIKKDDSQKIKNSVINNNTANVSAFFNGQVIDRKPLNLFSDEPPSLDIPDNIMKKSVNIFTDSDEENSNFIPKPESIINTNSNNKNSLFNERPPEDVVAISTTTDAENNEIGNRDDDFDSFIKKLEKPQKQSKSKTKITNLFDDDDSNDYDDFFKTIKKTNSTKVSVARNITKLFDDEDVDIKVEDKKVAEKPKVSIIQNLKVNTDNESRQVESSMRKNNIFSSDKSTSSNSIVGAISEDRITTKPSKLTSLFGDESDEDDIFGDYRKKQQLNIEIVTPSPQKEEKINSSKEEKVYTPPEITQAEEVIKPKSQNLSDVINKSKSALSTNLYTDLPPDDDNNSSDYLSATSNLFDTSDVDTSSNRTGDVKVGTKEDNDDKKELFKDKFKLFQNKEIESVKPIPHVRKSPIKVSNNVAKLFETQKSLSEDQISKEEAKPLPRKLNRNININVSALLPGAKRPSVVINKSADNEDLDEKVNGASPEFMNTTPRHISSTPNDENPNILSSLNKTRPKIQSQRRPSTRQGRKESYHKTMMMYDDSGSTETDKDGNILVDENPKIESIHDQLSNINPQPMNFESESGALIFESKLNEEQNTQKNPISVINFPIQSREEKVAVPVNMPTIDKNVIENIVEDTKSMMIQPFSQDVIKQNIAKKTTLPKLSNLFSDEPPEDDFLKQPSPPVVKIPEGFQKDNKKRTVLPKLSNIFSDEPPENDFEKIDSSPEKDIMNPPNINPSLKTITLPKLSSLFDDEPPEDDFEDIFVKKPSQKQSVPRPITDDSNADLSISSKIESTKQTVMETSGRLSNIFQDEPPPLDDSPPESSLPTSSNLRFNMFDDLDDHSLDDDIFPRKTSPTSVLKKSANSIADPLKKEEPSMIVKESPLIVSKSSSENVINLEEAEKVIHALPAFPSKSKTISNLFNDAEESNEDIFAPMMMKDPVGKKAESSPKFEVQSSNTIYKETIEEPLDSKKDVVSSEDSMKSTKLTFKMFDDIDPNSNLDDIFTPRIKSTPATLKKIEQTQILGNQEQRPVVKSTPMVPKSNKLSTGGLFSDEEDDDIFTVAAKSSSKNIKKPMLETKSKLFGSDDDEDDDIFGGGNKKSKYAGISTKKNDPPFKIEDDDDDDDLFNTNKKGGDFIYFINLELF